MNTSCKKFYLFLLAICCFTYMTQLVHSTNSVDIFNQDIHWNWDIIDLDDQTFWPSLSLPSAFKWGVATSAFQIEGTHCGTAHVQNNFTIDQPNLQYTRGCDHWNRYKEDVQLIKKLGVNQYRFSIAWEKIEPHDGIFDQSAMRHYIDLCKELRAHNIEPVVCLFHFTMPIWLYKQGGFARAENIQKFIQFAHYVFDNLNPYVSMWITYNEPIAYVIESYYTGNFPPYKRGILNMRKAGCILRTMLNAHVQLYKELKLKQPTAQIGIAHMFHLLDSRNKTWAEKLITHYSAQLMHESVLEFFKSGTFSWIGIVNDYNKQAPRSLDFIGVNYYRRELIEINLYGMDRGTFDQHKHLSDMGWLVYPEGLYRSIVKASSLNVPIYITENGIATSSDWVRNHFIKQHLYVVKQALKEGYDIRGYHIWTLMDCYEWNSNDSNFPAFGLYSVDFATHKRTLREGTRPFVDYLRMLEKNSLCSHTTLNGD